MKQAQMTASAMVALRESNEPALSLMERFLTTATVKHLQAHPGLMSAHSKEACGTEMGRTLGGRSGHAYADRAGVIEQIIRAALPRANRHHAGIVIPPPALAVSGH